MTKEEIINLVKARKTTALYKHIGESTNYFDYDQMDDIISALDTKEQMDLFIGVAVDEYEFYLQSTGTDYDNICTTGMNGFNTTKYSDIKFSLATLENKALKRIEINSKYESSDKVLLDEKTPVRFDTPDDWHEASNQVANTMSVLDKEYKEQLTAMKSLAEIGLQQMKLLNDKSLSTLKEQYENLNDNYKSLQKELNRYKKWFEDWNTLKEDVASKMYDSSDTKECGIDNPSVMLDAIQAILEQQTAEKKLQAENEELRKQQDAWRERPEYKAEIDKYKKEAEQQITLERLKESFSNATLFCSDNEQLSNFLLKINSLLKGTVWDTISDSFMLEMLKNYNSKQSSVINIKRINNIGGTIGGNVINNPTRQQ